VNFHSPRNRADSGIQAASWQGIPLRQPRISSRIIKTHDNSKEIDAALVEFDEDVLPELIKEVQALDMQVRVVA
jgi:hypothetical protein